MATRLSLTWLSIFFVVGVIAAAAGLWNAVRKDVEIEGRLHEPREDEFQLRLHVPTLQSDLDRTRNELAAVRSKMSDQRQEKIVIQVARRALIESYPALSQLGLEPLGDDPDWLAIRPEELLGFVRTRDELGSTNRIASALETLVEKLLQQAKLAEKSQQAAKNGDISRPSLDEVFHKGILEEQINVARRTLAETRVDLVRRQANLDSIAAADRRLTMVPTAAGMLLSLPAEAVATFSSSRVRRKTSDAYAASLEGTAKELSSREERLSGDLITAKRQSAHDFEQARENWEDAQRMKTLRKSIPLVFGLYCALALIHYALFFKSMNWQNVFMLQGIAVGALFVIIAYNVFHAIGGVLVAVAVTVVLLIALRGGRNA
jgi:hypothetical protein